MATLIADRIGSHLLTQQGQIAHYSEIRSRLRIGKPAVNFVHVLEPAPVVVEDEPAPPPVTVMAVPGTTIVRQAQANIYAHLTPEQAELVSQYKQCPVVQRAARIRKIEREVCQAYGFTKLELWSVRRTSDVCLARQEAYFRMKHETNCSLPKIGERCGDRDHTTVLHGIRKIAAKIAKGWRMKSLPEVIGYGADGYIVEMPEAAA